MSTSTTLQKKSFIQILQAAGMAYAAAAVGNLLIYFIGSALGAFPADVITPAGEPITFLPVVMATTAGVVMALVGYLVLSRFLAPERINRIFTILLGVIILASFVTPFGIQGAPVLMIVLLNLMHVVLGLAIWQFMGRK
jgi:hypothetical protein